MGTEIFLKIGGMMLDAAKNNMGIDYGHLFQESDRTRRPSDAINYDYYTDNDHEEELIEHEAAFVRPLRRVLPRLNMLGFTLEAARREYDAIVAELAEQSTEDNETARELMSFDEFCEFCARFKISDLDDDFVMEAGEQREDIARGRFNVLTDELARIPTDIYSSLFWSERSFFGRSVCILNAYSMLQVFGSSEKNKDQEVMWQYGPIVESGWVPLEAFRPSIRRKESILVATEGTSDAHILRRAIDVLRPDVADFFRFIDPDQRHPFSGTGNLVKFAEGLVQIDVQNRIVFLLDNDGEGFAGLQKIEAMRKPVNMRVMILPRVEVFANFAALGPHGTIATDINERAAAIECYLDLCLPDRPEPVVIWSNYKSEVDRWHGALEFKESYTKHFLSQPDLNLLNGIYNTHKLEIILDALIAEASALATNDLHEQARSG